MIACQLCQREFNSFGGLHGHIKKTHSYSQSEYYYEFEPRKDWFDGEFISYKTLEQYRRSDFNSRENFISWLSDNYTNRIAKDYCIGKLKERAERKEYCILPSQVELKSMILPSLVGFQKLYTDLSLFFEEAKSAGLIPRFDYFHNVVFRDNGEMKIFVDTREQTPLSFPNPIERIKVPCGDYFPSSNYFDNVFVERKSLSDLAGTLGMGIDRFKRELDKARELGFYLVIVIESLFSEAMDYSSASKFSQKITGAYLLNQIRSLNQQYPDIQWVFAGNRKRAAEIINKIFRLGESVRKLDLEFLKDGRII